MIINGSSTAEGLTHHVRMSQDFMTHWFLSPNEPRMGNCSSKAVVTDTSAACTWFTHNCCHTFTATAGCVHWHSNSELWVHSLWIKRRSKLWSSAIKRFSRTRWESIYLFSIFLLSDWLHMLQQKHEMLQSHWCFEAHIYKEFTSHYKEREKTRRTKSYWIKLSLHFKTERSGLELTAKQTNTGSQGRKPLTETQEIATSLQFDMIQRDGSHSKYIQCPCPSWHWFWPQGASQGNETGLQHIRFLWEK